MTASDSAGAHAHALILAVANTLPDGGSARIVCPRCLGGGSREVSLSMLRAGDLVSFRCWRAACGWSGLVPSLLLAGRVAEHPQRPRFMPTIFDEPTDLVDMAGQAYHRLALTSLVSRHDPGRFMTPMELAADARITESIETPGTLVYSITNEYGRLLGHQTRTLDKKIRTYKQVDGPFYNAFMAHDWVHTSDPVLLVEDSVSAAAVWAMGEGIRTPVSAVALLGTAVTKELAQTLANLASVGGTKRRMFVTLDPGAEEASTLAVNRLRSYGVDTVGLAVERDPKNLPMARLAGLVGSIWASCQ